MIDANTISAARSPSPAPRIVAIGASAGGLHALSRFFQAAAPIPGDIAFVIVVHLAPGAESHLPALLAKDTTLSVSVIEDDMVVRAGHVYVIPPKVSVHIVQGAFKVHAAVERPAIPMPIDALFSSLAADQHDRAIAIVLTGANADGSAGLRDIKAEGGMVMAQTPDTAEHSAMPAYAVATGLVDYVLAIEAMPAVLFDYIGRSTVGGMMGTRFGNTPNAATQPLDLGPVLDALGAAGWDFRGYKRGTLERRIGRRMAVNRVDTLNAYCDILHAKPEEAQALSLDMMIGVTEFFRDPEAWQALSDTVLSSLLNEPESEQPLRVWVPGCATGEEAYSMAMLLTEELERRQASRKFMILASDVNRAALMRARQGVYSTSIALAVGPDRLERFFNPHQDGYQIDPELRETVLFTPQNLIADPPFSRVDLISCRNLLIYLEPEAQQRVFELFHFALNPKRYLFLGRSESIDPDTSQFQQISRVWRIYQRSPVVAPALSSHRFLPRTVRREEFPPASRVGLRSKGYAELVNATLLEEHQSASVLINTAHQVLYVCGSADEYLRQPAGEPTGNILDMAREGLRLKLRIVLRRATQERTAAPVSEVVADGGASAVKITVVRLFDAAHADKALLVIFARVPAIDRPVSPAPAGADSDLWHLESELRTTQVELGSTIEELEESNTELRVSNEEILSMNEELRSANEELETSKEELQAVNEQLNSVNTQLEQRLRQLELLNEDMTNLLSSTEIATLLLDPQRLIKRFTPSAARLFGLVQSDLGRSVVDVLDSALGVGLLDDLERVLQNLDSQIEREIESADTQWYVRRVTPYLAIPGKAPAGVVITWTLITQIKLAAEHARQLAAVVQDSSDAVTVFDLKGRLTAWNRAATTIYGYSEAEALRMAVSDLMPPGATPDYQHFLRHAPDHEAPHAYETQRLSKDGRLLNLWITLSVLTDPAGDPIAIASIERELTERNLASAAYRDHAERLALVDRRKSAFLVSLSDRLRNPLAALSVAGELLNRDNIPATDRTWATAMVQRQGRVLTQLVDEMVDLTRITHGNIELHKQTVALKTIVRNAIEICQPMIDGRRHRLTVALPEAPLLLHVDPVRLSQVIESLLINAARYTRPGGHIELSATRGTRTVSLQIRDNGKGIAPAQLARLFEMFGQGFYAEDRDPDGSGISLSVVRRLVELHGGSIQAHSDGKTGSEFIIVLPLEGTSADAEPSNAAAISNDAGPTRILILDDNADAREALALLLRSEGHPVQTASDAVEGLQQAAHFVPEIVLLDLHLPGMDAHQIVAKLREIDPVHHPIVIAMNTLGHTDPEMESLQADFDHQLSKPLDLQKLGRWLAARGTSVD